MSNQEWDKAGVASETAAYLAKQFVQAKRNYRDARGRDCVSLPYAVSHKIRSGDGLFEDAIFVNFLNIAMATHGLRVEEPDFSDADCAVSRLRLMPMRKSVGGFVHRIGVAAQNIIGAVVMFAAVIAMTVFLAGAFSPAQIQATHAAAMQRGPVTEWQWIIPFLCFGVFCIPLFAMQLFGTGK